MSLVGENPTGTSSVTLVARAAEDLDCGSQIGIKTKHCESEVGKLVQWVRHQCAVIAVVAEIEKVVVEDANVCFGLGETSGHRAQRVLGNTRLRCPPKAPREGLGLNGSLREQRAPSSAKISRSNMQKEALLGLGRSVRKPQRLAGSGVQPELVPIVKH